MAKAERGALTRAVKAYFEKHPTAGPKEVVDALKSEGVEVSASLVARIKYDRSAPGKGKRGRKSREGNKSERIREYLGAHPAAKPKEIQVALRKQGVRVDVGLISNVKHTFLKNAAAPSVRAAARKTAAPEVVFAHLIEVKRLADRIGGADRVRAALAALEQLQ